YLRSLLFCVLLTPPLPNSTLFPYTTLFRSHQEDTSGEDVTDGNVKFLTAKPNTKAIWEEDLTDHSYTQLLNEIGEYSKYSTHLPDRKSTRLNSSHVSISYAVFCLKKKKYQI